MDGSVTQLKISLAATCDDIVSSLRRRGLVSSGCPRLLLGTSLLEGGACLNDMGVADGAELQLVLSRPSLTLDGSDNNLGSNGLEALVDSLPGSLQRVSLLRSGLCGKEGGQAVAKLVKASPGLEFLDLSGNNGFGAVSLGDAGIDLKALAAEIHSCYSLVHVILADCSLEGLLGGQELACLLYKTPNLQCLDVHSNNNLGPLGVSALSSALSGLRRPLKLTSLTLEDTGLEDEAGGAAAGGLLHRLPFLTTLTISNNLLLATGLQGLVKSMPETTCISTLDACNVGLPCDLSLEEAEIFCHLLEKCPRLKSVTSEGHRFDGPQCIETLSYLEVLKLPEELDKHELPKISHLLQEGPLLSKDLTFLTGLSFAELEKLRSFNLRSFREALQNLQHFPDFGGVEGGVVLIKLLEMMPCLEHLSFEASNASQGAAWISSVCQVFLQSLRATSRFRLNHSQWQIPRLQLPFLKSIDLHDCSLPSDAGHMLAELLHELPQLCSFSVAKNYRLENAGLLALAQGLQEELSHSLAEINLSCCSIVSEDGVAAVIGIIQSLPQLQTLAVSGNPGLGSHVVTLLEHVVCKTQISSLSCASCGISAANASFCRLQSDRGLHLTSLDISGNTEIGPTGLQSFTSLQMNLQRLNLADCGLESKAGGDAIAGLLCQCQSPH